MNDALDQGLITKWAAEWVVAEADKLYGLRLRGEDAYRAARVLVQARKLLAETELFLEWLRGKKLDR